MSKPPVKFIKIHQDAQIPTYKHDGDAGMDLHICQRVELQPGERKTVTTGLKIKVPEGYEGQVRPRSGLAHKHGITVVNSPGTIDSGYTGELLIILLNTGTDPVTFICPDRIAQLVISPVEQFPTIEVSSFEETTRGENKFGSTGL